MGVWMQTKNTKLSVVVLCLVYVLFAFPSQTSRLQWKENSPPDFFSCDTKKTFSCGFLEEECVCVSMCARSVTHWQRVLLLAVLNLDQKPAVSEPMPRKRAVWFCTPHSTAANGARSYKYSNRVRRRGTGSHCICTQRGRSLGEKPDSIRQPISSILLH